MEKCIEKKFNVLIHPITTKKRNILVCCLYANPQNNQGLRKPLGCSFQVQPFFLNRNQETLKTSCNPHLVNAQGTKVADSLMSA